MKVKCDYCDSYIDENEKSCPRCGAPNASYNRESSQVPKTIGELKQWYADHDLPPENVTRFFIGRDIKEAKAFGIYRSGEDGDVVVYKNKADGLRIPGFMRRILPLLIRIPTVAEIGIQTAPGAARTVGILIFLTGIAIGN